MSHSPPGDTGSAIYAGTLQNEGRPLPWMPCVKVVDKKDDFLPYEMDKGNFLLKYLYILSGDKDV